jgi:hypothetical protein
MALEFMGKHIVEQIDGKLDPTDQLQLDQLILNVGKARPARIAAQPQEECGSRSRKLIGGRTTLFPVGGPQQRFQPCTGCRCQTMEDACIETLIMGMERGTHDAIDTVGRWRFDRKVMTSRLKERHKMIGTRTDSRRLIPKPILEHLPVGDGCFPEAKQGPDFGTMTFDSSPRQAKRGLLEISNVELPCDFLNSFPIDLSIGPGESPALSKEQQQYGEAQLVGPTFGRHERVIGRREGPSFGEIRSSKRFHLAKSPSSTPRRRCVANF